MQNVRSLAALALVLFLSPVAASAEEQPELIVGGLVGALRGWSVFCKDYPSECEVLHEQKIKLDLNVATLKILNEVNVHVNSSVQFKTDIEHWGTRDPRYTFDVLGSPGVDKWDFAEDGFGDCEDYANLKKKMLIDKGFPRSALLLTVVSVPNREPDVKTSSKNERHMVLMVRTNQGDLILDYPDATNDILPWYSTEGYEYESRQSQEDPNVWVALSMPTVADVTK